MESELTVRYDVYSASWYVEGYDLVTVVTPDRAAFDCRVSGRDTDDLDEDLVRCGGHASRDEFVAEQNHGDGGDTLMQRLG